MQNIAQCFRAVRVAASSMSTRRYEPRRLSAEARRLRGKAGVQVTAEERQALTPLLAPTRVVLASLPCDSVWLLPLVQLGRSRSG
jgi:hypothetical protein